MIFNTILKDILNKSKYILEINLQKKSVPCTLKTMITKHTLKVNAEINVFLHFLHFHEEIISFKNAPAFLLRGARHAIA